MGPKCQRLERRSNTTALRALWTLSAKKDKGERHLIRLPRSGKEETKRVIGEPW